MYLKDVFRTRVWELEVIPQIQGLPNGSKFLIKKFIYIYIYKKLVKHGLRVHFQWLKIETRERTGTFHRVVR